jgi:D-alanyl-D-alanine carboxypeptidase/D-alanyl-D-alanine-endopeptidase (penicillin-binding protein 4)
MMAAMLPRSPRAPHRARRSSARWLAPVLLGVALLLAPPALCEPEPAEAAEPAAPEPSPLADALDPIMDDALLQRVPAAVQVVDVATGEEVYARGADHILLPASTMKVVTTAAALRTLGPAYTFHTDLLYTGEIDGAGVLHGDLYVRGGGDPTLVLERLWKLVQELRLEGVRRVAGDVYFDDDHFDLDEGVPGWNKPLDKRDGPAYYPPLGALSLNYNSVAIFVGPGPEQGGEARVDLETPSAVVEVNNEVTTGPANGRRWIKVERELAGVKTRFTVKGVIPEGSDTQRYYRSVGDPTAYFTGAFAALCKQQGIQVGGRWLDGSTPDDAVLLVRQRSPSLGVILQSVDKYSNNFMAEMVLKAMGAEVHGLPGTTDNGILVVRDYLEGLGLDLEGQTIANGSGLTRLGGIRPELLTAVMVDMYDDRQVGPEFRSALAIGGLDGTLRSRFGDEDEVGRVRGKTGSLDGVHCLTGYVEAADGRVYAFAFLVNRIPGPLSRARQLHDAFVRVLLEHGAVMDLAELEDSGEEAGDE